MILSVMQPGYMPYAGFFELMARCDAFVIYDDVQYDKNSWRNRNKVLGLGGPVWLTVPTRTRSRSSQAINKTAIDNTRDWRRKHRKTLDQCYSKSEFYPQYGPAVLSILQQHRELLIDICMATIETLRELIGVRTKLVYSSTLKAVGTKTDHLVAICQELGADAYLAVNGSKPYLEPDKFEQAGIQVAFQDYKHPEYPQFSDQFVSHLSVLDLLFHCGPRVMDVILSTSQSLLSPLGDYRGLASK